MTFNAGDGPLPFDRGRDESTIGEDQSDGQSGMDDESQYIVNVAESDEDIDEDENQDYDEEDEDDGNESEDEDEDEGEDDDDENEGEDDDEDDGDDEDEDDDEQEGDDEDDDERETEEEESEEEETETDGSPQFGTDYGAGVPQMMEGNTINVSETKIIKQEPVFERQMLTETSKQPQRSVESVVKAESPSFNAVVKADALSANVKAPFSSPQVLTHQIGPAAGMSSEQEETVTNLDIGGLTVLMVRKKDQIIYKLPDNIQVSSLSEKQRRNLLEQIRFFHEKQFQTNQPNLATTYRPPPYHQQNSAIGTGASGTASLLYNRTIPSQSNSSLAYTGTDRLDDTSSAYPLLASRSNVPGVPASSSSTIPAGKNSVQMNAKTVATSLSSTTSAPAMSQQNIRIQPDGTIKKTRKYNKTGKYSKKRAFLLQQQQMSEAAQQGYPYHQYPTSAPQGVPGQGYGTAIQPVFGRLGCDFAKLMERDVIRQEIFRSAHAGRSTTLSNYNTELKRRFDQALEKDNKSVWYPNKTPFTSLDDAIQRLLPYHVYQYKCEDLETNAVDDMEATRAAFTSVKRRRLAYDKYKELIQNQAEESCPTHLVNLCERLLFEDEKAEVQQLRHQHEALRQELERRKLARQHEMQPTHWHLQQQMQTFQDLQPTDAINQHGVTSLSQQGWSEHQQKSQSRVNQTLFQQTNSVTANLAFPNQSVSHCLQPSVDGNSVQSSTSSLSPAVVQQLMKKQQQ